MRAVRIAIRVYRLAGFGVLFPEQRGVLHDALVEHHGERTEAAQPCPCCCLHHLARLSVERRKHVAHEWRGLVEDGRLDTRELLVVEHHRALVERGLVHLLHHRCPFRAVALDFFEGQRLPSKRLDDLLPIGRNRKCPGRRVTVHAGHHGEPALVDNYVAFGVHRLRLDDAGLTHLWDEVEQAALTGRGRSSFGVGSDAPEPVGFAVGDASCFINSKPALHHKLKRASLDEVFDGFLRATVLLEHIGACIDTHHRGRAHGLIAQQPGEVCCVDGDGLLCANSARQFDACVAGFQHKVTDICAGGWWSRCDKVFGRWCVVDRQVAGRRCRLGHKRRGRWWPERLRHGCSRRRTNRPTRGHSGGTASRRSLLSL